MIWFKCLLMALLAIVVIVELRKTTGWRPEASPNWAHAVNAVASVLLLLGIYAWL